ncbi:hypothetical protein AB1Y20_017084 [Prymnesium parvum]|uniref:EF-hand domain-containing protein n=1 Tax=Prymnesium parvum TaxID=97485 RepID=A0AB34I8J4_PRYPA
MPARPPTGPSDWPPSPSSSHASPRAADPSPPPPRHLLLRRPLSPTDPPDGGSPSSSAADRRHVLLAHRIRPGQTITLKTTHATATMPDAGEPQLESELLLHAAARRGPSYDAAGQLRSFSVLGPPADYERRAAALAPLASASEPIMSRAPLQRAAAREAKARDRAREALSRAELVEERHRRLAEEWERQAAHLSRELGREPSALMMSRSSEFRQLMLERQQLEAIRNQNLPYAGERAWQLGLRSGGIFYEPVGSYLNGLFCPFRPPNQAGGGKLKAASPALERLESLEQQMLRMGRSGGALPPPLGHAATCGTSMHTVEHDAEHVRADEMAALDEMEDHNLQRILALRDKYNIEGAAPAHLTGQERTLWGIFREIDVDESGSISKLELQGAFFRMGLDVSNAEMVAFFKQADEDGSGRIDIDEFIETAKRVPIFSDRRAFQTATPTESMRKKRPTRIVASSGAGLGPAAHLEREQLAFEAAPGQMVEQQVRLVNTGSTALQYTWCRQCVPSKLRTAAAAKAHELFLIREPSGQVLPGANVPICFSFRSAEPGIFTETWRVSLSPSPSRPPPPLAMRAVCLAAPAPSAGAAALDAQLQSRALASDMHDLLASAVLPAVFAAAAAEPPPRAEGRTPPPRGEEAAGRWRSFTRGYAAEEALAEPVARDAFVELDVLWRQLGDGAPSWEGCPLKLEALLFELAPPDSLPDLTAKLESILQHALAATPDVSRSLRLRQTARHAAADLLDAVTAAVRHAQLMFDHAPIPPPPAADAPSRREGIASQGEVYLWSWETERYEIAAEKAQAEVLCRAARGVEAARRAEAAAWEQKKAAMNKRERKKAEAAEAAAAEEAARVERARAEVEAAAAAEAKAALEADPEAMHEACYKEALHLSVAEALREGLLAFLEQADELEREEERQERAE